MQILLSIKQKDVRDMIGFSLEGKYQAKVSPVANYQQAVEKMLEDQNFDLVICEYSEDAFKFCKYLLSTSSKLPILFIISDDKEKDVLKFPELSVVGFARISNGVEAITTAIDEGIKSGRIQKQAPDNPEYIRIKTELLVRVAPLKGDVYIRLSNIKYVKMFKKGDVFSMYDVDRILNDKKIEFLYIRKQDFEEFVTKFKEDLIQIEKTITTDPVKANSVILSVHETVHELVSKVGFTKEIQEVAMANVRMSMKTLGSSPRLSNVLKLLSLEKDKYISSHSILLGNIACCIAKQTEWPSDTTFQKLTLAAFCHDICLITHNLAQVHSMEDLEKGNYTEKEKLAFKNHPLIAAEYIRKMNETPPDVDVIIAQHHERPDGSGFPRGLEARYIAPLAAVFIIAHAMVNDIYRLDDKFDPDKFFEENKEFFKGGPFTKIFASINPKNLAKP